MVGIVLPEGLSTNALDLLQSVVGVGHDNPGIFIFIYVFVNYLGDIETVIRHNRVDILILNIRRALNIESNEYY